MANRDITYCNGKGCGLRERCRRYIDGQRIIANVERDEGQYYFWDHCDEEHRDGFMELTNNRKE